MARALLFAASSTACLTPPGLSKAPAAGGPSQDGAEHAPEAAADVDAWTAVPLMSPGINIGNTLENTTSWETGWGNPRITKGYVESVAHLGFKTVRLPVAWDTYAVAGKVQPDKFRRVAEVVDWITGAGMFCVIDIHWDGGWIDSDAKDKYPSTHDTFSAEAEQKFRSYWEQISTYFAGRSERVIFEALNEETNFGSTTDPYATLTRVNQIFVDTVRNTGGNNAKRLLIIAGYATDITKTCDAQYALPKDTVPGRLFVSVHYYTPYTFCGLTEDAPWGKMLTRWGSPGDVAQLGDLFDAMKGFCTDHDVPAFIGEFGVATKNKEPASRVRWMSAVLNAAISRKMVPVLWDTGNDVARSSPYSAGADVAQALRNISPPSAAPASAPASTTAPAATTTTTDPQQQRPADGG
jgi:endoglucanase